MLRYKRIILDSHKYAPPHLKIHNVHERKLKMRNQLCVPANILITCVCTQTNYLFICMRSDKSQRDTFTHATQLSGSSFR